MTRLSNIAEASPGPNAPDHGPYFALMSHRSCGSTETLNAAPGSAHLVSSSLTGLHPEQISYHMFLFFAEVQLHIVYAAVCTVYVPFVL